MELLSILCYAFFTCGIITVTGKSLLPKRGGWERLGDAIMMILIAGGFFLLAAVTGMIHWSGSENTTIWLKVITVVCAIPDTVSLLLAIRLFSK